MKRGLLLSLSALALLAAGNVVHAQTPVVNISLNLRYNDPAAPADGGKWFLVVKAPASSNGVAGLSAYISGINTAGIVFGTTATGSGFAQYGAVTQGQIGANVNTVGNTPFNTTIGSAINVVYGQNNAVGGAILANVGKTGGPGAYTTDPLRKVSGGIAPQPADWNNSTVLMSGTFGATRPAFVANVGPQSNNTDANLLGSPTVLGTPAINADVTLTVRGDSLASLGLEGGGEGLAVGDATRDFAVNNDDFAVVVNNFFTAGGWDNGDVDGSSNGQVNNDDFSAVINNFFTNQTPPAAGAVPEPASMALAAVGAMGALFVARRRK